MVRAKPALPTRALCIPAGWNASQLCLGAAVWMARADGGRGVRTVSLRAGRGGGPGTAQDGEHAERQPRFNPAQAVPKAESVSVVSNPCPQHCRSRACC